MINWIKSMSSQSLGLIFSLYGHDWIWGQSKLASMNALATFFLTKQGRPQRWSQVITKFHFVTVMPKGFENKPYTHIITRTQIYAVFQKKEKKRVHPRGQQTWLLWTQHLASLSHFWSRTLRSLYCLIQKYKARGQGRFRDFGSVVTKSDRNFLWCKTPSWIKFFLWLIY